MKKIKGLTLLTMITFSLGVIACKKVKRVQASEVQDYSGSWNSIDARLVREKLILQIISHNWHRNFILDKRRKPVVVVGDILNETHEHIQEAPFINEIENALLENEIARIVANREFRARIRQERAEHQNGYVSESTRKKFGKELGADFMIMGKISSIADVRGRKKGIYYRVSLTLVDLETNEKVWAGSQEIDKVVKG